MFWLNMLFMFIIVFSIMYLAKWFLRKLFNIKKTKKKLFSYNHINKWHAKIDWGIRIVTVIVNFILIFLISYERISILSISLVLVLIIISDYLVRAFFEWRYTDNPKEAILTVSDMVILLVSVILVFGMNLLNLNVT
ncbi:DUF4181 domain-containing protein [Sutcliffiella horikoshii]|uniref:DUF4181 domain-containing protein n=1 Tax=Sutcliffiella horikoshii TaxID=79883 RepID=UPI001CFDFB5E|nr:DUF4181 domain-containing protein [Sutcliffiella horikoshii]